MTDMVMVKPIRTFDLGDGVRTDHSPAFKVERGTAVQLKENGLVDFVTEDDAVAPASKRRAKGDAVE